MPEPLIREARPDEAAVLAEIGARTFTETFGRLYPPEELRTFLADAYSTEYLASVLADPAQKAWLVEQDGEAVGHALAGPCALPHPLATPNCREVKRIYLLRRAQGGGLGGRLFQTVTDWLERDRPRDIWLGVWSENHGAQRFYARRGFEKVGEYGFPVGSIEDLEFILRRTRI